MYVCYDNILNCASLRIPSCTGSTARRDAFIAVTALVHGVTVVTRKRHGLRAYRRAAFEPLGSTPIAPASCPAREGESAGGGIDYDRDGISSGGRIGTVAGIGAGNGVGCGGEAGARAKCCWVM